MRPIKKHEPISDKTETKHGKNLRQAGNYSEQKVAITILNQAGLTRSPFRVTFRTVGLQTPGTARRYDWVKDFSGDVVDISLKDCADKPVSTHVGELHLTRHAVERFKERLDIPNVDRAWKRLTKLMTSGEWNIIKPIMKMRNDKKNRTTETWAVSKGHASPINIVVVRHERVNRVVTVIA